MTNQRTNEDGEKKENFIISRVKRSVIIRGLMKFASAIYKAAFSSVAAKVLSDENDRENATSDAANKRKERGRDFKHAFAALVEKSKTVNLLASFGKKMMRASVFSYGVSLFSFGFYVILIYAIKMFSPNMETPGYESIVLGATSIIFSLFCFSSQRSAFSAIDSSIILGKIVFGLFGMRRPSDNDYGGEARRYVALPFFIGTVLGVLTVFVSPIYVLIGVGIAVLGFAVFRSPETGLIIVFLALPFAQTLHLVAMTILIFVSFMIKYLCGRRMIKFELIDVFVLIFAVMTLSGGFFAFGSGALNRSLVYFCFIGGYFLVKMSLSSPALSRRAMYAVSIACAVVSIIGIVEYFVGSPSAIWQDKELFSDIKGRVVSTFQNPNVLGEYLILTIPISVALAAAENDLKRRIMLLASSLLGVSCLVLTWSRGAWLGMIVATVVTLLFVSRKWLVAGILALPAGAAGLMLAGGKVVSRLTSITNFSDSSTSYRINIWRSTLAMLKDTFFYGIGTGAGAFETVFPFYALPGLTKVEHSHSLYLQITVETGIFSLVVFLAVIFLFIRRSLTFGRHAASGSNRFIAAGLLCGISAFLLQGFTDFVFYNYRVALMFWMMLGLAAAHIYASKSSAEENDALYGNHLQ